MKQKPKTRATISFILIVCHLIMIVGTTGVSALTNGPTVPEVTKFEPVDTKDIVNLYTGDFVYTLPVIDIPGPAGGYALALSYKAGISTEEEASWVGLGWNLQPGSISRNLAGLPDDFFNGFVQYKTPDLEGGGVSISVSSANSPAAVSAGIISRAYPANSVSVPVRRCFQIKMHLLMVQCLLG